MNLIDKYAKFVSKNPVILIFLSIILLIGANYYSGKIINKSMDFKDMLPDSEPVIAANNYFTDTFGGSDNAMLVLTIDSKIKDSNEITDIRDPRAIEYAQNLENYILDISENIEGVDSATSLLKLLNNNKLPGTINEIKQMSEKNGLLSNYISDDNQMLIIKLQLSESFSEGPLVSELEETIKNNPPPEGILARAAGNSIADNYVNSQLGDDMSKTGLISMIGIILVLIFVFSSPKYSFLPLVTIIFGVSWTFGFIGFAGITMSPETSGVLSMIMGIGIDFGIQIITRFRQELKKANESKAMYVTLKHTIFPMLTTTLAAIIGFRSMALGQLTVMASMGTMMMYGVIFCFFAAITIVPAVSIFLERLTKNFVLNIGNKQYKLR